MLKLIKVCLQNGVLLLIPLIVWNVIFINLLPEAYTNSAIWDNIPYNLQLVENISKLIVFTLPLFIKISFKTKLSRIGFFIYLLGNVIYFLSWIVQIFFPESNWSSSVWGFVAPAYTTIIIFIGIGLMGKKPLSRIPHFPIIYTFIALLFVIFHSLHAYLVFESLKDVIH